MKKLKGPPANRWRPLTMFPLGAVLEFLNPVAEGVLGRGIKFQNCKNILKKYF
jgi:hypothetical protein